MEIKEEVGKRYVIRTKDENYCGVGAGGVQFAHGRAELEEGWVLQWYRERGYAVEEVAAKDAKPGK